MDINTCALTGLLVAMMLMMTNALQAVPQEELDPNFWHRSAKESLTQRLRMKNNYNVAKNVILFIGDGMGGTTVTASRILKGQLNNKPGEETVLAFEEFPNIALSKTYNIDRQTADSAGTATAIMSGVKTNYYTIGVNGRGIVNDCQSGTGNEVDTMLDWAQAAGKRTGLVVTSRITHATPAAAYAHTTNRYWEGDVDMAGETGGCKDIAQQLVDDNPFINVLLGGGRRFFLPNTTTDPEYNNIDSKQRQDGRNLVQDWKDKKAMEGVQHEYVWNKQQFENIDTNNVDYLLGLFEPNHMQYTLDRNTGATGEPSLAEMTKSAIEILRRGDNGYFLMVEGSRIDHGHHDGLAAKALHEVLTFEEAIKQAVEMTDDEETLIIVTADHSHVFDIAGYSARGTDIFGLVSPVDPTEDTTDGKPYSVLYYGNGPGYTEPRTDLTNVDMSEKDFMYPAGVPMPWETHGGEDVAIYAQGPMSHLFYGTREQNYIAHVMAFSACVGPYKYDCDRGDNSNGSTNDANIIMSYGSLVLFIAAILSSLVAMLRQ